jgi:hypothetical protein
MIKREGEGDLSREGGIERDRKEYRGK